MTKRRMTSRRIAGLTVFSACAVLLFGELWLLAFGDGFLISDLAHEYVGSGKSVIVGSTGFGLGFLTNHFIFRW